MKKSEEKKQTNHQKEEKEQRGWDGKVKKFFILLSVIGIAMFLLLVVLLNGYHNVKMADSTCELLLHETELVLDRNEAEVASLQASIEEDYITRAKAVAHFVAEDPNLIEDSTGLATICELVDVDEINFFDTKGKIYAGTVPEYFGMTMNSGEQIGFFLPMLEDKSLTLCQSLTPNTAMEKEMTYAMVWEEDGSGLVQIGIDSQHYYSELDNHTVADVVDAMPMVEGVNIYVADGESEEILGATNRGHIGSSLEELGIDRDTAVLNVCKTKWINQVPYRILLVEYGDYGIGITYRMTVIQKRQGTTLLLVFLCLLAFDGLVFWILNVLEKNKRKARKEIEKSTRERDEEFAVMRSMSQMYYSMHLLDLKKMTYREYGARSEVSDLVYETDNLKELVDYIMTKRSNDVSRADILEFCDLDTLAERMKDLKSMYRDFHGTHGHWCRCSFIKITSDEEGYPLTVMITVQTVEAEKRREEKLLLNSNTDSLTSCYNRRAYEEYVDKLKKEGLPENLVYLSMDVNGLKAVNDTYGHAAGDELIIGAANCMRDAFGKYGNLYRTGGDEFIAILTLEADQLNGLLKEFGEITKKWTGKKAKKMTVACGYVTSEEVTDLTRMETLADQRMYEAKSKYYRETGIDRRKR